MTSKRNKYESSQINSHFVAGRRPVERSTYNFNDSTQQTIVTISTRNLKHHVKRLSRLLFLKSTQKFLLTPDSQIATQNNCNLAF